MNKSDYVASITAINGVLNGGPGPYCLDIDKKSLKYQEDREKGGTWLSDGYLKLMKLIIVLQNICSPYLTKDRIQENIIKVMKLKYEK